MPYGVAEAVWWSRTEHCQSRVHCLTSHTLRRAVPARTKGLAPARSTSWQHLQEKMQASLESRDSLQGELASLQAQHAALQVTC